MKHYWFTSTCESIYYKMFANCFGRFVFYDANCLYCCLLFYERPWRNWIRPKCGNEMSCLRRHWTTRQRTYRICEYQEIIYTCVRYVTGKQLNTYIDAYAGRTYEHLYFPSRIQTTSRATATLNARVTTAVKAFLKPYRFCNLFYAICWDYSVSSSWKVNIAI